MARGDIIGNPMQQKDISPPFGSPQKRGEGVEIEIRKNGGHLAVLRHFNGAPGSPMWNLATSVGVGGPGRLPGGHLRGWLLIKNTISFYIYIFICKPIGVKSNISQCNYSDEAARRVQIPLLVAGPDGTAINTQANT
jgi:hypothetical protein